MLYYVIMFEEAEHFKFAKNPFRANERLKNVGHFFQGDAFTIPWICHRPVFKKKKRKNKIVIQFKKEKNSHTVQGLTLG